MPIPRLACDTHAHCYCDPTRFPVRQGTVAVPGADAATYAAVLAANRIERSVIVQPSAYGSDNRCTLDAVRRLGPERARAVAVIAPDLPVDERQALRAQGVRGLRLLPGVRLSRELLRDAAAQAAPLGWHIILQPEDGSALPELLPELCDLPVPVVVDHLGRIPAAEGMAHPAFRALRAALETGRIHVKISAPYHGEPAGLPYPRQGERVRALASARPDRLLWASNWPHPSLPPGAAPDAGAEIAWLLECVPDPEGRELIFARNAARLYFAD